MRWLPLILALCAAPAAAAEIDAEALDRLPQAQVYVLGEVHDNVQHHLNQARAVAAIAPKALVFEMLSEEAAAAAPRDRSDAAALAQALGWEGSGWPDFALYHPIFTAAPRARLYGAEAPREQVRSAVSEGAADAFGAGAAALGLGQPLPPEVQAEQEAEQHAAHCEMLPADMLPGMVEAQRLRDAFLLDATRRALAETGGPVAVITGSGHARKDRGFVAGLKGVAVLALGQMESPPEAPPPYDLWLVTPPQPREDPCAAFGAAGN